MEVGSGAPYPGNLLGNYAPLAFVFDGVECASMEGLLQSFKFEEPQTQREVCMLVGEAAKQRGQARNDAWKKAQRLWWQGVAFDRHGEPYQRLLDRAFDALARERSFRNALLATGTAVLTHSIGKRDPADTVLTEEEFVSRLMAIRARLQGAGASSATTV